MTTAETNIPAAAADRIDPRHPLLAGGVLCFGGEDWWYHNRGHCDMQMMRQFARYAPVLYVNSVVMRRPNIREGAMFIKRVRRKLNSIGRGLQRIDARFAVYSPITAPVHHLPFARQLNQWFLLNQVRLTGTRAKLRKPLVWVNCPAAADAAIALRRRALVYQRTDRYEDYPGVDYEQVRRFDQRLKQHAELTFYSNRQLFEQERDACRKAVYVEHGVDYDHFADAAPIEEPTIAGLSRPIAGFFGGIDDHTFDAAFMLDVIKQTPEVSFVFIGNKSIDFSAFESQPNVATLPQQPYTDIPRFGAAFDVCLMPWRQNRWIEACNPIKLKEYLALGKPIVSTPFPELARFAELVEVAPTPTEFSAAIRRAGQTNDAASAARRQAAVRSHSWEAKANQVLEAIDAPST